MQKGKLYLIPTVLNEDALHVIPNYVIEITKSLSIFFVENEKTARRYLRKSGFNKSFDDIVLLPLNEHIKEADLPTYIVHLLHGNDCGMMSEAGLPAVADPGSGLVQLCHQNQIQVIPLVGPSSIFLALMASGLNGQQFIFHGYIPIKQPERIKFIQKIDLEASKKITQIFIETPYRNKSLLNDILQHCNAKTQLCIASDLTGAKENIETKTIQEWRILNRHLDKVPTIFLIG